MSTKDQPPEDDHRSYLAVPVFKDLWGDAKEITPADKAPNAKWYFTPLYKRHASGKKWLIWITGFDGIDKVVTIFGQLGGALRASATNVKIKRGKETFTEQAHSDAKGTYKKKMTAGSHLWGQISSVIKPMLANTYQKVGVPSDGWPVAVQAKLDGMRAVAKLLSKGEENKSLAPETGSKLAHSVEIQTRNGEYVRLADHIALGVQSLFAYLPTGSVLDGEIYVHNEPRVPPQKIAGLVGPKTKERSPLILLLKYFIYDLITPTPTPYEDRFKLLASALLGLAGKTGKNENDFPFVILNHVLAKDEKEIRAAHKQNTDLGYEGSMVRILANDAKAGKGKTYDLSLYKHGRSNGLLKYKDFFDEEGVIIGYHFAEGGDKMGALVFEVKDPRGNTIGVSMKGENEMWKDAAANPERFKGLTLTYKYQNLTDDGKARFPVGLRIRDKSSEGVEEEEPVDGGSED